MRKNRWISRNFTMDFKNSSIGDLKSFNGIRDYYNRKGFFSDKGEKKEAFFIMKEWYRKKKEQYK